MRTIIVTGYARSGTSLTAGILHHLGVNMGDQKTWRVADEANEKGYFENSEFVMANHLILNEDKLSNFKKIVDKHKSELWGMKDPRFIETWEHWKPFIENPMFIVCDRKNESVAESVCFRDDGTYSEKKEYDDVIKDIRSYKRKIYKTIKDYPRLYVDFDRYFKDKGQIKDIADFVGVPYKDIDLVDSNLKHF